MSVDAAHSLADAFDLPGGLTDKHGGEPVPVAENLWIQEVDVTEEIGRHWKDISGYITALLAVTGVEEVLAEELAIFPGMEEVSALLYVNRYAREKAFDVLILDCAPTGESLRFVSLPPTLDWYMTKLFRHPAEHPEGRTPRREEGRERAASARTLLRERPVARRQARRRRRAPEGPEDDDRPARHESREDRDQGDAAGVHVLRPLRLHGGRGHREPACCPPASTTRSSTSGGRRRRSSSRRRTATSTPFRSSRSRSATTRSSARTRSRRSGPSSGRAATPRRRSGRTRPTGTRSRTGGTSSRWTFPFVGKEEVDLAVASGDLVVRIGNVRHHVPIPRTLVGFAPSGAKVEDGKLTVRFARASEAAHAAKTEAPGPARG